MGTTRHGGTSATDGETMVGVSTVPSTHVTNSVNLACCTSETHGDT